MQINNPSVPPVTNSTTTAATALKQVSRLLGVGAAPAAWWANTDAIELPNGLALSSDDNDVNEILFNAYKTAVNTYKRLNAGYSFAIRFDSLNNFYLKYGGTGAADSTIGFSNALVLSSTLALTTYKTAATNYTRVAPNYCQWQNTSTGNETALTAGNNTIAAPAADAKFVDYLITVTVKADGTTGLKYGSVNALNASLAGVVRQPSFGVYDHTGVTSGNTLAYFPVTIRAPVFGGNTILALNDPGSLGLVGTAEAIGYGD